MNQEKQSADSFVRMLDAATKTAAAVLGILAEAARGLSPWSRLAKRLPDHAAAIARLRAATELDTSEPVRVAAAGKYNHGKSTLLNALCGEDHFPTGDTRTTTEVLRHVTENAVWIDTPGLDADVPGNDDSKARTAVIAEADVLLVVHNLDTGELDRYEVDFIREIQDLDMACAPRLLLVLSCREAVDDESFQAIKAKIAAQVPDVPTLAVSSLAYREGISANKPALIVFSGFATLQTEIFRLADVVMEHRQKRLARIRGELGVALEWQKTTDMLEKDTLEFQYTDQRLSLEAGITRIYAELVQRQVNGL